MLLANDQSKTFLQKILNIKPNLNKLKAFDT